MKKRFATTVSCMDGRIQKCVYEYVSQRENAEYVDTITLAGPSKVIDQNLRQGIIENLKYRLNISINGHKSSYVSVVGHFDCAAIEEDDITQQEYIVNSAKMIQEWYPNVTVEALWVTKELKVEKLDIK